jgi:hypothetical protein
MGNQSRYRAKPKTYVLKFEDDEYDGLVVKARSVKLGGFLEVAGLVKLDPQNIQPEDVDKFAKLFDAFGKALVEWNLDDDDGEPVPPTAEGLHSQDTDFVMPIIKAWFVAIAGVGSPLGQRSSSGDQSQVPSIPMEPLSVNHTNSPKPTSS